MMPPDRPPPPDRAQEGSFALIRAAIMHTDRGRHMKARPHAYQSKLSLHMLVSVPDFQHQCGVVQGGQAVSVSALQLPWPVCTHLKG